jgi:serine protease Do
MGRLIKLSALTLLALVALANGALLAGIWLTQDPAPRPLTGERIFNASRPAVMLIQANYQVTVSLPEVTVPQASKNRIEQQLLAMVRAGRLPLQEAAIEQAAINLMLDNPDAYVVPGPTRATDEVGIVATGSGFFVTEDGYLVTAAHVVSTSKEDIRGQIIEIEKEPGRLTDSRTELQKAIRRDTGLTLNNNQLDKLLAWEGRWLAKYVTVDKIDARYYLASGLVEAGQQLTTAGTRLSLVTSEPVSPGRDVAVMKADVTSVPALALAASSPGSDAATYVVGYPRRGFLGEDVAMDATVDATLSTGKVRSELTMDGGWTAIGTTAQLTHGNSGGPVLDRQGRVLGMASFVNTDTEATPASEEGFFVPAAVIRETLVKASVKPAGGTLTGLYYQALSQGDFHHYKHELAILSQVQSRSAWHAYVKDAVSTTQSAVLSGKDQTPPELGVYVPASLAALAAVTVIAITTMIGLGLRRRATARAAARAAAASAAAETAESSSDVVAVMAGAPETETMSVG